MLPVVHTYDAIHAKMCISSGYYVTYVTVVDGRCMLTVDMAITHKSMVLYVAGT